MNQFIQKQKEKIFKDALAKGKVFVGFVHNEAGVSIPETMLPGLGLYFSRNFANALSWDSGSIKQRLVFDVLSFDVVVPWSAVVYISSLDKSIAKEWVYDGDAILEGRLKEISFEAAVKYGIIKPCPECNSSNLTLEGIAQETQSLRVNYYSFKCLDCDYILEYEQTSKEALEKWNEQARA